MPSMKWWPLRSTCVEPQQRHQRQILLHADAGQRGEVFGRHEVFRGAGLRVQLGDARGVEDRLVKTLAVLAGDAAVAERERRRERRQLAVGLIDDERLQPRQRVDRLLERRGALDGLLDEERGRDQALRARASRACAATARRCPRRRRIARCRRASCDSRRPRGRAPRRCLVSRSRSAATLPPTLSL